METPLCNPPGTNPRLLSVTKMSIPTKVRGDKEANYQFHAFSLYLRHLVQTQFFLESLTKRCLIKHNMYLENI